MKNAVSEFGFVFDEITIHYDAEISKLMTTRDEACHLANKVKTVMTELEKLTGYKYHNHEVHQSSNYLHIEGSIDLDSYGDYLYIICNHKNKSYQLECKIALWEAYEHEPDDKLYDADEVENMHLNFGNYNIDTTRDGLIVFENKLIADRIKNCDKIREYFKSFYDGH